MGAQEPVTQSFHGQHVARSGESGIGRQGGRLGVAVVLGTSEVRAIPLRAQVANCNEGRVAEGTSRRWLQSCRQVIRIFRKTLQVGNRRSAVGVFVAGCGMEGWKGKETPMSQSGPQKAGGRIAVVHRLGEERKTGERHRSCGARKCSVPEDGGANRSGGAIFEEGHPQREVEQTLLIWMIVSRTLCRGRYS